MSLFLFDKHIFYACFFFSERIEVPVLKRRREVLPLNINTPEETAAASATGEDVSRLPLERKEESCLDNLKDNTVQWKQPASLSPHKSLPLDTQPKKEKCVTLVASPASTEVLHEQSGNTPSSPRSVCLSAWPPAAFSVFPFSLPALCRVALSLFPPLHLELCCLSDLPLVLVIESGRLRWLQEERAVNSK